MSPLAQKGFMYGFPILTLAFTWWLPAAVQLSFFATSMLSLGQALLFRSDKIRTIVGLSPKPVDTPAAASPYKGTMRIAASAPPAAARPAALSTSELNSRFQQPSNLASTGGNTQPAAASASPIMDKLKGQFSGVNEFRREILLKGKTSLENRQKKADKADAEAFEKKRSEELKTKRQEEVQRRRAQRAARKWNE